MGSLYLPIAEGGFPIAVADYSSIQTVGAITEMVQGRLKPFFMQIGQVFESFKRWKKTNSSKNPDKT